MSKQYPFEFAKTRVQLRNQSGVGSSKNPFLVVSQVFRDEGVRALYKGCSTLVVVCIYACNIWSIVLDGAKIRGAVILCLLLSILIASLDIGFDSKGWCSLPRFRLHQEIFCRS